MFSGSKLYPQTDGSRSDDGPRFETKIVHLLYVFQNIMFTLYTSLYFFSL